MMRRRLMLAGLVLPLAGCMAHLTPMQRGLDASMERTLIARDYLAVVSSISAEPSRIARADGYVYAADVGPQLRYMALTGDSVSYRRLLNWANGTLVRRHEMKGEMFRRYRANSAAEPVSVYGAMRMGDALNTGWRLFKDTTSAMLAAQIGHLESSATPRSAAARMIEACATVEDAAKSDPASAKAFLREHRKFKGGISDADAEQLGLRGDDADLVMKSCLTRISVTLNDPDATVFFTEQLLDAVDQMREENGRPFNGTSAEILLALKAVISVGPTYYEVGR